MSDFESHHAQIVGPGMWHPRLSPRVSRCAANGLSRLGADPRRDAKAWPQLRFRLRIGDETDLRTHWNQLYEGLSSRPRSLSYSVMIRIGFR